MGTVRFWPCWVCGVFGAFAFELLITPLAPKLGLTEADGAPKSSVRLIFYWLYMLF